MGEDILTSAGMAMTEEQQSMPLRDAVFMSLRKAILTGKLKPGDRLTEVKLGKLLGTSRTPIRVMEIRSALEQLSAGLASERITEAEKVQLREACMSFNRLTQTRDSVVIAEADVRFHDLILKAAKNGKLKGILDGLADNIYRYRYEFIQDDLRYEHLIAEHLDIYNAIVSGNREEAEKAAQVHIDHQYKAIREQLLSEKGDQ